VLVNLLQKDTKDRLMEYSIPAGACHLWHNINECIDACVPIGLVLSVLRVYANILENLRDPRRGLIVLATVVVVKDCALGGGHAGKGEGGVNALGALVVQDVCADLANLLWRSGIVEVVILDLEVLAKGKEDVEHKFIVVEIRLVLLLHGKSAKE
jgi:hypothetical protein